MKAVILAAGMASRLRPLTDHSPKCLLRIGSKCLLQRTLEALIENGIEDVIIVTGYLKEKIEAFIGEHFPKLKVVYVCNERYQSTNNIYSLWLVKQFVWNEDILLLDSDILFESGVISTILAAPYPDCLALNVHELGDEEIKVIAGQDNRIVEISKTCSAKKAIGESIGIEKLSNRFVRSLFYELDVMINEQNLSNVFYEAAFENLIRKGAALYAVDTSSCFSMELDTVADFQNACDRIPLKMC
ncbi:MAG: phosphocholine cytidylyltransferase family protein [Dysgonamonadaceae bacterium]|jgi:choline kinase|nr:phosphocholine cytidylyltransferase family protein [Dysgonamonadaceae bacterium]